MKNIFLLIFLCVHFAAIAQHDDRNPLPHKDKEQPFDISPVFPGGPEGMNRYFRDSIRYPEPERSKGIQGNVLIEIKIDRKGSVVAVRPINGVPGGPNLVKEATRLMLASPQWQPATKKGKPVDAEIWLSVPFRLKSGKKM